MSKEPEFLPCDLCGKKSRRMFFVKYSWTTFAFSFVGVLILGITCLFVERPSHLNAIGMYVGLCVTIVPWALLTRMRCLECEPEWKDKIWAPKLDE